MAAETAVTTTNTLGNAVSDVTSKLTNAFVEVWNRTVEFAPKIIAAVVVLVAGYFVAKLIARLVSTLCDKLGLQQAAERSGLAGSMAHMGIRKTFPNIVSTFAFWLLMCVFLMATFNIMNLESLTKAMESVVNFIPHLLVATVVVVVGLLIAGFLRGVIATSADRVGLSYAEQLANGCYYVLALMVFLGAFDQLHIKFELLNNLVLISFGGLAIGFALAAGLGGRDVMAGILAGYYLRQRLQAGDTVSVGSLEGTIREVGPTATVIETDEHGLLNRHTVPNTKMLNEAVR